MVSIPENKQENIHLSSLEWIIGSWYGGDKEEKMEENWNPIMIDAMTGWFRWKKGDSIFLYEFMLLQQVDKNIVLKIKHFDSKLVGWEEKDKWVEYVAWSSSSNRIMLKASDPKHTPWIAYERDGPKLTASFYDASGNLTDSYEFHS
jgi:hypothetical protein